MGSSTKKKKEKKKDFQKPKLKVGKAKAKPTNHTDTSFKSKAIVLNQQSLSIEAPSVDHRFAYHVSLLSSRSESQRKDSLSYLTNFMSTKPTTSNLPQPVGTLLEKCCPLILDGNSAVRSQLLKFLQSLPYQDIQDHVAKPMPYVRAGMTHLSSDIRMSSTEVLSWLLTVAGNELVSSPGGWQKSLDCCITLLGWRSLSDPTKWTSSKASFGSSVRLTARVMQVLAQMIHAGLDIEDPAFGQMHKGEANYFPLWQLEHHLISQRSNAYTHLDLFGIPTDAENQMLEETEDRRKVFDDRFRACVVAGLQAAKKEGGELGRAAGFLTKALDHDTNLT